MSLADKIVVSLFPGLGFFDRAFEAVGFTVVRGPDVIWGGDVRTYRLPAGVFEGVIGGPPCQPFSPLVHMVRHNGHEPAHPNLIPQYERLVGEGQPRWFVMEESRFAPLPVVPGYQVHAQILNNRWLGEAQNRVRRISFGTRDGRPLRIQPVALEAFEYHYAVTSQAYEVPVARGGGGKPKPRARKDSARPQFRVGDALGWAEGARRLTIGEMLERQGYAPDLLDECPLTAEGKRKAIGNAVPRAMGEAIARGICTAMGYELAAASEAA